MITRHNYEEFFLLYADNELSPAERKDVEDFVLENADLEAELTMLQQARLEPENFLVFENKELLLKQTAENSFIDHTNYEEYFLLYIDNELDEKNRKAVEKFVNQNPSVLQELELLQQTLIQPEATIVFEGKEILYKKEEDEKVILFPWFRVAAAAIVLLAVGLLIFNNITKHNNEQVAGTKSTKDSSIKNIVKTGKENKKESPAVTSTTQDSLNTTEQIKKEMVQQVKQQKQFPQNVKAKHDDEPAVAIVEPTIRNNDSISSISITSISPVQDENSKKVNTLSIDPKVNKVPRPLIAAVDEPDTYPRVETEDPVSILYMDNTSARKNKLRGVFRKVSRVFGKASKDDDDNNKRGVLVGSFQIALK